MTNYVSGYDFMDLLKDNGYVPLTDRVSIRMSSMIADLKKSFLQSAIEFNQDSHDFMDLLSDKGMVPEAANDNEKLYTLVC